MGRGSRRANDWSSPASADIFQPINSHSAGSLLIAPDITDLTWLDSCAKSWTISAGTCLQTARTHFFHSAAHHDTWLQYIWRKMRLTGGGIPRYIGTGRILPALLAEGQQKYEVLAI